MQKKIAIIGYGNQGKAWAHNLKDSGWQVGICLRPQSSSTKRVIQDAFDVIDPTQLSDYPTIAVLIPDHEIPDFAAAYAQTLSASRTLVFAHGFCLHFKTATWPEHLDILLLAPKGIGSAVRQKYCEGSGVPAVTSIEKNISGTAQTILNELCHGLGAARVGVYSATAQHEVTADLLSEQSLLCGGVPFLLKATFDILVKHGISPEVAYLECVHEMAFMAELFATRGIAATMTYASPTAQFGGALGGQRLISPQIESELENMLVDIQRGTFKEKLDAENSNEFNYTRQTWESFRTSQIERVGESVRARLKGKHAHETKNN